MKSEKSKYIFTIILALLEIFLTATGLGFYTIGRTAVTVLHIPVFLATTLIGLPYGLIIAGVFGFSSMYSAFSPTISALNALKELLGCAVDRFKIADLFKAVFFV